jgi:predicted lactoylglutathione lyase
MEERPVLDQVNVVVGDMAASVEFYRLLGVEIDEPGPPWEAHHRAARSPDGLDLDLDSAAFAARWNRGWPDGPRGVVIGFRLVERDAVDELYARVVDAGHRGQQPPFDAFWGARYAVVTDPDGNAVGMMSAIDPARRSDVAPPD